MKLVVRRLQAAGVEYMITGSVASSLQGEPRATHDIDVVIAVRGPAGEASRRLKEAFPEPDFYLDEMAARDAITAGGMFNLIDTREATKVDFWLVSDDAFDQARFARRYVETFEGAELHVSRPEDTVLMKLRWAAMLGGSEKQFTDALRVYEVQHGCLDEEYMTRWAATLGVSQALEQLRREARPVD